MEAPGLSAAFQSFRRKGKLLRCTDDTPLRRFQERVVARLDSDRLRLDPKAVVFDRNRRERACIGLYFAQ